MFSDLLREELARMRCEKRLLALTQKVLEIAYKHYDRNTKEALLKAVDEIRHI